MKLHNNPLSHQTTPGDHLVMTNNENILIESKQTISNIFVFERVTQLDDLLMFQQVLKHNKSYLLIMFYEKTLKKSSIFLIPIHDYQLFIKNWHKKSINKDEADIKWCDYMIDVLPGSILNIVDIFRNSAGN